MTKNRDNKPGISPAWVAGIIVTCNTNMLQIMPTPYYLHFKQKLPLKTVYKTMETY